MRKTNSLKSKSAQYKEGGKEKKKKPKGRKMGQIGRTKKTTNISLQSL